jgi:LysR family hydrogen peroxide-inducible transcriptional activator
MMLRTPPAVSLRQIQYIVAVAELGGFRRAADACGVSQPSLSAQVALAERALGVQIFERNRRRVRVSAAGSALVAQARRVLAAARELDDAARQLTDPFHGTLRLGVIPTVCPYLLPDITPALRRKFPALTIAWREERTGALVRELAEGTLDAAIVARESSLGDLEQAVIMKDAFVLAAAPGHPLVRSKTPARPDVLEDASVLLLDDGHCLRDQALRLCARGHAAEVDYRATSLATLVQMVSTGDRVTLLPALAVPVENRRGQLGIRAFAAPAPGRTLVLAWRKGSALRESLTKVTTAIREATRN